MPIDKVSVNYERKFNLGDYQSATYGVTIWYDVEEGEEIDPLMHSLWEMARENVKAEAMPVVAPKANFNVKEAFLGIPVLTDVPSAEPEEG